MIRLAVKQNLTVMDDLEAFLESYTDIAQEEFQAAVDEVWPFALDELQTVPPRRQWPGDYPEGHLEWESERQQRAYWATDGFGKGIPYPRTGELPAAWAIEPFREADGIGASIVNRNPAAPFVYGSLAKSNPGRFQQRFHRITGWERMYDTVVFWLDALQEAFVGRMNARLGDLMGGVSARRRAYTRTRRRR